MQASEEMHMVFHATDAIEMTVEFFVNTPDVSVNLFTLRGLRSYSGTSVALLRCGHGYSSGVRYAA